MQREAAYKLTKQLLWECWDFWKLLPPGRIPDIYIPWWLQLLVALQAAARASEDARLMSLTRRFRKLVGGRFPSAMENSLTRTLTRVLTLTEQIRIHRRHPQIFPWLAGRALSEFRDNQTELHRKHKNRQAMQKLITRLTQKAPDES